VNALPPDNQQDRRRLARSAVLKIAPQPATHEPPRMPQPAAREAHVAAPMQAGVQGPDPGSTRPGPFGVLVDDATAPGRGQVRRADFLAAVEQDIERVAGDRLSSVGCTTRDCPYLAYWLRYYSQRSAADIERALSTSAETDVLTGRPEHG